jgi:hypothetical protein
MLSLKALSAVLSDDYAQCCTTAGASGTKTQEDDG